MQAQEKVKVLFTKNNVSKVVFADLEFWVQTRFLRDDGTLTPKGLERYNAEKRNKKFGNLQSIRAHRLKNTTDGAIYKLPVHYHESCYFAEIEIKRIHCKRMSWDGFSAEKKWVRGTLAKDVLSVCPAGCLSSKIRFEFLPPEHPTANPIKGDYNLLREMLSYGSPGLISNLIRHGYDKIAFALIYAFSIKRTQFDKKWMVRRLSELSTVEIVHGLILDAHLPKITREHLLHAIQESLPEFAASDLEITNAMMLYWSFKIDKASINKKSYDRSEQQENKKQLITLLKPFQEKIKKVVEVCERSPVK